MTKVVILGLDGATFDYMNPWLAAGHLPHLARLMDKGISGTLRSTFLPTTAIAWPSMLTGKNPGKHGIFDFRFRQPGSYTLQPSLARGFDGDPLHRYLSRLGYRVGMVNVPMTYPPTAVQGIMISGFTTPEEATDWAFPPTLPDDLAHAGCPYPFPQLHDLIRMKKLHTDDIETYVEGWGQFTATQAEVVHHLLSQDVYDFFMLVFSSTDHINHHTPDLTQIRRIHEQVDQAIGRILEAVDEETTILVVSDHGSDALKRYIVLNRFLADMGLIAFKPEVAPRHIKRTAARLMWRQRQQLADLWRRLPTWSRRLLSWPLLKADDRLRYDYENIDWQHTRAYASSGIGSLYINLKGREPQGIVEPGAAYERLREQIIAGLLALKDPETNGPLIQEAKKGDDLFHGPHMAYAPDIVFSRQHNTDRAVTGFATDPIVRSSRRQDGTSAEYGYHTPDGILIATGPGLKVGDTITGADIHDIAPTVLHLLGQPVPTDMDGQVLQDLWQSPTAVGYTDREETSPPDSSTALSATATEDIEDRLRALGYLD